MKNLRNKYLTSNNCYPIITTNSKTIKTKAKSNAEKVLSKRKHRSNIVGYCEKRNAYILEQKNGATRYVYL